MTEGSNHFGIILPNTIDGSPKPPLIIPGAIDNSKPNLLRLEIPGNLDADVLLRTDRLITKDDFSTDNQHELRKGKNGKIGRWQINYHNGKMFIRIGCADARPIYDEERVWNQRSVASGFPHKGEYVESYIHSKIEAVVVTTHYGLFENGHRPEGCGGQDAKAEIEAGTILPEQGGVIDWVDKNVDKDPIVQGINQAKIIIDHLITRSESGRVFVTTQDHTTGKVLPVAEFNIVNGILMTENIPPVLLPFLKAKTEKQEQRIYDPAVIYADGIPQLSIDKLSSQFIEYLEIADNKMEEIHAKRPDFAEKQAAQNPWALVISANKIPIQNRYPTLFGEIGSAFEIDIPRSKSEKVVSVSNEVIEAAICQMQYAMEKANAHNGDPTGSFSKSKTLLIETGSFHQSQKIAEMLFTRDWAKKWLALGGRVFVAETQGPVTQRIEEFQLAA